MSTAAARPWLHYHEAGDPEAQTVVLLHGGGSGKSSWSNFSKNIAVLAKHFTCWPSTSPATGIRTSTPNMEQYNRYSSNALLRLLFDHLGIKRAALVGNSLGGGTAVRFALDNPDRARPAGADGPRRVEREPVRTRPDRGRQAARPVHRGTDPGRDIEAVPAHHGLRPEADHPELIDERFAIASQPESLAAAKAMGRSFTGRTSSSG